MAIIKALGCLGDYNTILLNANHKSQNKIIMKRLDIITEVLQSQAMKEPKVRLEKTYNVARRRGYPKTRKTFQRDIDKLEMLGKLKKETHIGGNTAPPHS